MSRTYETMVPSRPEMHNIIRTAFDRGLPYSMPLRHMVLLRRNAFSVKRLYPFETKLLLKRYLAGNIDQKTGQRLPGLNSRPEHIKEVVEGMLKRLRTDRIDLLYQHRVDPAVPKIVVIKVASKLLDRIRFVLLNQQPYKYGNVK